MAIRYADIKVELREVLLTDKPQSMLDVSPKGTVPVLILADGLVLDESLEIMSWTVQKNDSDPWRVKDNNDITSLLLAQNDGPFKQHLDHYKYADRFPNYSRKTYREQGEDFLLRLEKQLTHGKYLSGAHLGQLDIAIFPFIRQFAFVDKDWFDQSPYKMLQRWLAEMLSSRLFLSVMTKCQRWQKNSKLYIL